MPVTVRSLLAARRLRRLVGVGALSQPMPDLKGVFIEMGASPDCLSLRAIEHPGQRRISVIAVWN